MGKYFGTDGIRGTLGDPCINPEFAFRFGAAVAGQLKETRPDVPIEAVIGRDTRQSGPVLVEAIVQGLNSRGVHVHDLGVVPTPAVARMLLEHGADVGIAVTASHNPASDNGYKLFDAQGCKLSDQEEALLESRIDSVAVPAERPSAKANPSDGASRYMNDLLARLDRDCLSGWKVVLDLANGATAATTPEVFRGWGAEVIALGDQPDGRNINAGVGSEHPGLLGEAVRSHGAQLGIAHDGDGDRIVVCDEQGAVVDGDILLGLFALHALESGTLAANTLVATVQSNLGLDHAVKRAGGSVLRAAVGDRNVARMMRESGANIGGESSGHIIFSDHATTGDGLLAAAKLIELMLHSGRPLSELRQRIELFPQETANLRVSEKLPLESLPVLKAAMDQAGHRFGEDGRVLVRYSGTEPKLRVLAEGRDPGQVSDVIQDILHAAKTDLPVIED